MPAETMARFVHDPVAPDSAQFPLGRPLGMPESTALVSADGVRPWGLRDMAVRSNGTVQSLPAWRYDHERQLATDLDGVSFRELRMDPSADSSSSLDGDEGPNEDWTYDFHGDFPGSPA
ncbi:putative ATP-grasp-modified RiPP [Saccharopolyspora sp. NPDC000359]|uniref:putative ATP-grasp-modified RiPP n=1 Tax=Saccharopolyspora sp. NPDC000359 TaxID=3154251 RepID=UPI003319D1BA